VALPPAYAGESLRAAQTTYYGSPAKGIAELGWQARDLLTGLRDLLYDSAIT
jgi:hypothetical protein